MEHSTLVPKFKPVQICTNSECMFFFKEFFFYIQDQSELRWAKIPLFLFLLIIAPARFNKCRDSFQNKFQYLCQQGQRSDNETSESGRRFEKGTRRCVEASRLCRTAADGAKEAGPRKEMTIGTHSIDRRWKLIYSHEHLTVLFVDRGPVRSFRQPFIKGARNYTRDLACVEVLFIPRVPQHRRRCPSFKGAPIHECTMVIV